MIKQLKKLMKLTVLTAGLLAAVPQTAQAGFNPYGTMGTVSGAIDPHGVYTGSILLGSLASYILLRNVFNAGAPRHCHCNQQTGCFAQVAGYCKHVATTALNVITTGIAYATLSSVEKIAMKTSDAVNVVTTTTTNMPTNAKLAAAAVTGAAAVGAGIWAYVKYKARQNNNDDAAEIRFHNE